MLGKLKSLFATPIQKEKPMTATATNPTQTQTQKTCPVQGSVEQLSATSESCGSTGCCEATLCQEAVQMRAYFLWDKAGRPEGDGVDFWITAEQELSAEAE
jgi:hypothetical protein